MTNILTESECTYYKVNVKMWHDGNSAGALLILERVLADGSGEMKRVALMLAGMIKEGEGDYEGAANDWSRGLSFSSENPFVKFQLELNWVGLRKNQETQSRLVIGTSRL